MSGTKPFPSVHSSDGLKALPARMYVECTRCVGMHHVDDVPDPVAWAEEHTQLKPWHVTFRVTHITNFSTGEPPTEDDAP